ncbi:MAG TPA: hypothetical protein VE954_07555 [Oligoflexus sp.]|uniref:hypothetical protein n=1 Tax=Oligoflexus sp. TaxID=1971216 RepID=UPI002D243CC4|nr:hypothetical protein [Oligoflexus sp.]HYX32955.1 hypothetical protein [Oligoflexus sp.]
MQSVNRSWRRYAKWLGFIILTLNIVLVSIPRCEFVMAMLQHQWADPVTAHEGHVCHEDSLPAHDNDPAFTSKRLCQCSVFQFMAFHAPALNWHEYVYFRIQSERLLTFPSSHALSQFYPRVEPPYPKA